MVDPHLVALPWRVASKLRQEPLSEMALKYADELQGDCLIWVGRWTTGNGYGKLKWRAPNDIWRDRVAHRVIYEYFYGPLDDQLVLDHLCLRRECCQPLHLDPVTVQINTHRGRAVLYKKKVPECGVVSQPAARVKPSWAISD
jgi:hypothetical protein